MLEDTSPNALFSEDELGYFEKARVGTYFVLPLRANIPAITDFTLERYQRIFKDRGWVLYPWEYDDLYQHINELFSNSEVSRDGGRNVIGINYELPIERAMGFLRDQVGQDVDAGQKFYVCGGDSGGDADDAAVDPQDGEQILFSFRCVQVILMHTGVGFLVLGIESNTPEAYDLILNSGHNDNRVRLGLKDVPDARVNLGVFIDDLLRDVELTDFANFLTGPNKRYDLLMRDTIPYTVAIVPGYLHGECSDELREKIRHICLNIRHGQRIGSKNDYLNSDELFYNKFASTSTVGSQINVRWGVYTIFEMTTQVIFCRGEAELAEFDPINIHSSNREDNYLPFIIIALYERYSYLFLSEIIRRKDFKKSHDNIDVWAEEQMIVLKALGIMMPSDMTPYSNENSFLLAQREIYEIPETLQLIDDKIDMINHIQEERAERRERYLEMVIAVFGFSSIICDTLGVVSYLFESVLTPLLLWSTFLGEVFIIGVIALFFYLRRK